MSRTSYTFSVLQATAAVASLAIIMWSLGLPVLQFAEAANVTTFSNTLSDSAPGASADHTIYFETPSGIATGTSVTLDFSDGPFVIGAVDFEDIDVQEGEADFTVAADCTGAVGNTVGASFTGTLLTIDFCGTGTADIAANGSTTIQIGQNADGGVANAQIQNPPVGSHQIVVTAGADDTGETRVFIVESVRVSATVDTIFTFTVSGVGSGVSVNTADTTGGVTSSTSIPFGELAADTASTAAQNLEVSTNAANGFIVTVTADQQLTSSNGADIDGFTDGSFTTTPIPWTDPNGSPGVENEAGHWGLSTTDDSLSDATDFANGDNFVSASTTPVEIFYHNGPTDGSNPDEGTATAIYKVQITALQEAADDYTATLTYVATPVF